VKIDHLIDGKAIPGREYYQTVNPATQDMLAEVAIGGSEEVDAAVKAAKAAFPAWAGRSAVERSALMRKLGDLIMKHATDISRMETRDTGQPINQIGRKMSQCADHFYYYADMCTRVEGQTHQTPTHLNYTLFHPVGVCALIAPSNVPFMSATGKVAPALAFGNTAVLKVSQVSPLSVARLGELALEAGISAGVLNLVHGDGMQVGGPLCRHPEVRVISFTGCSITGNQIIKRSGLKKFSMELSGKSPFLIFEDADLPRALDAAVFMAFSNNGERRTGAARMLVHESVYDEFSATFSARATRVKVGDPLDESTIVGPLVSRGHLAKVRGYIEAGLNEGASLLCGGVDRPPYAAELPPALRNGNYLWPTVFANVDNSARIAREEIFGPVACLMPFKDEADAIAKANDSQYGSSSYVWSENTGRAHRVAAALDAAMCFVNSQNVRELWQPYGGTKASGVGREGGRWAYEVFLEPKNVCMSMGLHRIARWGA
jgi:5-carboxymethyl-2-hydroxymuconic-semialdehyde dehydrogenase